eukprot:1250641-Rhodomonas_salina.1
MSAALCAVLTCAICSTAIAYGAMCGTEAAQGLLCGAEIAWCATRRQELIKALDAIIGECE